MNEFRPVRLSDEQRLDWLRLIRTENVGPRTFRTLINQFGGAKRAIERLPDLARRGGRALNVVSREEAAREMSAASKLGIKYVGLGEIEYPPLLRETEDAPPLLAVRGNLEALAKPAIAMVGSRNASAAGLRFAAILARELGEAGFVIVSGFARGIDTACHRASLASGTVAVLAGGHDKPYPPEHAPLLEEVIEHSGAAVSEMPLGWEPRGRDFPRRNRIIAGLSFGVVVVEAADRSGSLITARRALDINREVFAVPGSPVDPRAGGTNRLLREGATLVTSAADIIEVIAPIMGMTPRPIVMDEPARADEREPPQADNALRTRIQNLISHAPVSVDDLARAAEAAPSVTQIVLLELELGGRLRRHAGGMVSLV
jgi:DNA processing protein